MCLLLTSKTYLNDFYAVSASILIASFIVLTDSQEIESTNEHEVPLVAPELGSYTLDNAAVRLCHGVDDG